MHEYGYEKMSSPVEEMLASYLSMGETSSLKTPSLPSKLLQVISRLNNEAYAAAGQDAYQADLLKDLDKDQVLSPKEVAELRCTTDLAFRATKQAVTAMGRSEPEQDRGTGLLAQKTSVATCAPPPPAGGSRRRR
ncbi:hypothetical protein M9458_041675, partial [Cirrhinus mrigala]